MVKPVKNAAPKAVEQKPEAAKGSAKKAPAKKAPAAPVKKAPVKKKAEANVPAQAAQTDVEQEVEATGSLGRKDIAAAIRVKVHESGAALPEKLAEAAVKGFEEVVEEAVAKGQEINLPGFGKFSVKLRPARMGRNPQTGEATQITASYAVAFKPGKALKDAANVRDAAQG